MKKEKTKQRGVYIPFTEEFIASLDAAAQAENRTRAAYVRNLILIALNKKKDGK